MCQARGLDKYKIKKSTAPSPCFLIIHRKDLDLDDDDEGRNIKGVCMALYGVISSHACCRNMNMFSVVMKLEAKYHTWEIHA